MNREKNPTMNDRLAEQEKARIDQENEALKKLLDELEKSPRELSPAELVFLQRIADRLDGELAKSGQEAGIEHDDIMDKVDKINYWQNPTKDFIDKTNYPK